MTNHKMSFNKFEPRIYQQTLFDSASKNNTLIVLPTGLGKTAIGFMLIMYRLKLYPDSKIVFLAPTKPLVDQHLNTFNSLVNHNFSEEEVITFNGSISPKKRQELWNSAKVIFSTPQGFENDVLSNRINFKDVSLIIFDEAHRGVGDYSYVFLASEYKKQAKNSRILALTASPGSDRETILDVLQNLFIESVEVKASSDPDVAPYLQETDIEQLKVVLPPEIKKLLKYLNDCYKSKLIAVKNLGYLSGSLNNYNKSQLLKLQSALFIKSREEEGFEIFKAISLLAEAGKIQYAIELAETQGLYQTLEYLKKLEQESLVSKRKAVKNLVRDVNFRTAKIICEKLLLAGIEHPKLAKLKSLASLYSTANPDSKIIIFTQYRNTAMRIKEYLDSVNLSCNLFFGQSKKNGVGHSQKKQKQLIQDFKDSKFKVLIATSVAEEGLDIPSVDLVVFYETIPSAIRTVQRRGRTGRHSRGRIITLITKETRDEAFKWISKHKEKNMYRIINEVKKTFFLAPKPKPLDKYINTTSVAEGVKIYCDYREKGSKVLKALRDNSVDIKLETLQCGDFLLSDKTVIEFKNAKDFVDSIIDKRIFNQAKKLSAYENPIIIIESAESMFTARRVHPNAILGALSTLLLDFKIPVIYTKDSFETANLLIALAKREQKERSGQFTMHSGKPLSMKGVQEFVVAGFPGIAGTLNKELLKKFGSIKSIVNADESELKSVELIGKVKAKRLFDLFNSLYKDE